MTNLLNPLANRDKYRFAESYSNPDDPVVLNCDAFILSLKPGEILAFSDRADTVHYIGGGGFEHFPNGVIVPIGINELSSETTCAIMALWHWKTD